MVDDTPVTDHDSFDYPDIDLFDALEVEGLTDLLDSICDSDNELHTKALEAKLLTEVRTQYQSLQSRLPPRQKIAAKQRVLKKPTENRAHGPSKLGPFWDPCGRKGAQQPAWNAKGRLSSIAAMILMTLMYSARIARYDLQKPIAFLAKRITCWDPLCDQL